MALKDRIYGAVMGRTGLTPAQTKLAVDATLELICAKMPATEAAAVMFVFNSENNNVDPKSLLAHIEDVGKKTVESVVAPVVAGVAAAAAKVVEEVKKVKEPIAPAAATVAQATADQATDSGQKTEGAGAEAKAAE